jgi:hypothetical protein
MLTRLYGIFVNLDDVDAVFECTLLADRLPGQLALFADRDEPAAEPVGNGAAEDEPARLDARHRVDFVGLIRGCHAVDGRFQTRRIAHQGGHIAEQDPGLGVVRDCTYQPAQIVQLFLLAQKTAQNTNIASVAVESFVSLTDCTARALPLLRGTLQRV